MSCLNSNLEVGRSLCNFIKLCFQIKRESINIIKEKHPGRSMLYSYKNLLSLTSYAILNNKIDLMFIFNLLLLIH